LPAIRYSRIDTYARILSIDYLMLGSVDNLVLWQH